MRFKRSKKSYSKYGRRRRFIRHGARFKRYRRKAWLPRGRYAKNSRLTKQIAYKSGDSIRDTAFVKLKYTDSVRVIVQSGVPSEWSYKVNDPYDPAADSTTFKPYYFNQYAYLYGRYICYGSSINVKFFTSTNKGETQDFWDLSKCIVCPLQDNTSIFSIIGTGYQDQVDTIPRCKSVLSTRFTQIPTLSHYMKTGVLHGLTTKQVVNNYSSYGAATNASPSTCEYWHVAVCPPMYSPQTTPDPPGPVASQLDVMAKVTITYYVKFYERKYWQF